jgi:pre-rRNA-processing protein TSR2
VPNSPRSEDQETDGESEEGDVEMGEAPRLVRAPRERAEPEIDDGSYCHQG